MGLGIPPLKIKSLLESKPLNFRLLVRELTVFMIRAVPSDRPVAKIIVDACFGVEAVKGRACKLN